MLLFPDRQAGLGLIDNIPASIEGRCAVRRRHAHPDRQIAQGKVADSVGRDRAKHPEAGARLGQDAFTLRLGQRHVGLVFEGLYRLALVVVAHPALERHASARAGVGERRAERGDLKRGGGDAEH